MKQSHTDSFSPPGEATYTIAIDMGGTNIKIGLMKEGLLIERREIVAQSASGLKSKLPELEKEINQLLDTNEIE